MISLPDILTLIGAFLVALVLTGAVRAYTLRSGLLDVPNERSLHKAPTPRGGGIAIVTVFLAITLIQTLRGNLPVELALALLVGGTAVALVGWIDDRHTLGNRVRLAIWIPTAIWAVYWVGGLPSLELGIITLPLRILGAVLAVIGVLWMLNLYNFMDGIDGIAGSQTVTAATAAGIFLLLGGHTDIALLPLALAAASLGFLVWNWPPAKIFMGDVGSGFIGFTFAVLAIWSENTGTLPLTIWAILLAVFLIDATFTVARRMKNREKWFEAHRSHAYQVAVQTGASHRTVTLAVIGINLGLAVVAGIVWNWPEAMLVGTVGVVIGIGVGWLVVVERGREVLKGAEGCF